MNIKIGENIRRLRSQSGITQEKLAEYLGVSAQAVSRWESEACYPDLEMLPGIASYFGVSIDSLLGYDASEQEQLRILMHISELASSGRIDEAREEARRGLSLYPKNHSLATLLASYLITYNKGTPELDECIELCKRVLRDCSATDNVGEILRYSVKNMLIVALVKNDDRKGALEVAQTLPIFSQIREINIQMSLEGEERWNYSLSVLPLICTMLGSSFLNNMAHTDTNEKSIPLFNYSVDECRRDIALWDALYYEADKRDGGSSKRRCFVYMFLHFTAARRYAEQGDKMSAIKHLAEVLRCISEDGPAVIAAANSVTMDVVAKADPACIKRDDNYLGKSSAYFIYYGYIANGCFEALESEPGYLEKVAAIKHMADTTCK